VNNDLILVLDSGYGGMHVLNLCKEKMPEQNFIFLMDDKNCPYGNKTKGEVETIVVNNIVKEIENNSNIKMVILACNTATACAIEELRKNVSLPVVGIEPALKPALDNLEKNDNILVLCTPLTKKYAKSVYQAEKQVPNKLHYYCNSSLASLIDKNISCLDDILPWLSNELEYFKQHKITRVVLGCTHYTYLQNQIEMVLGNVKFYLSESATAEQARRVCEKTGLNGNGRIYFKSTGKIRSKKMQRVFDEHFRNI